MTTSFRTIPIPSALERLLFTYNPFADLDPYPSPGPVFVHAAGCAPFAAPEGIPEPLRALPLTLEGYGAGRWLVARERVEGGDVEGAATRLFAHPAVAYVHVRNSEGGGQQPRACALYLTAPLLLSARRSRPVAVQSLISLLDSR